MRYSVPVFVRRHADGRVTLGAIDPGADDLVAHGETREAAARALADAAAARIEDPLDGFGDRLLVAKERELRRVRVPIRVLRPSGRRGEVVLPVTCIVVRPAKGAAELFIPRLGIWLDLEEDAPVDEVAADEVRRSFAGGSDVEVAARAPDAEETVEAIEVDAKPRSRLAPPRARRREEPYEVLAEVGTDLCAEARRGAEAAAYGRDGEVGALLQALAAPRPPSVLLVGPAGVGKSAIVAEAARRIALGEAPAALEGTRIFHLSGSRIISGMSYFGDWQERCREIVDEARERRATLFVDDLAELCEVGRMRGGGPGVASFFAPHVARGEVVLIAEATPERLRRVERIDPALPPLFRRTKVQELSRDATLDVLRRASGPLGRRHGVRFEPAALEAAVELAARFMPGRRFPGKALALLARAARPEDGARRDGVAAEELRREPRRVDGGRRDGVAAIDRAEVIAAFSHETGLPDVVVRDEVALERGALVAAFEERVVEQPEAARALADAVLLAKTGLADPTKPVAVYLFVGPTGVGKTESARALAERLFGDPARLARFDMSEYQDGAAALRLGGGDDAEGELARRVREQPFSVLLLDEIEKAHESVFDLLLSVLGEGRLVDHGGRVADFRSAIVVLTSNLGAGEARGLGFGGDGSGAAERHRRAAERFFRPELLNRIDRIVPFGPLSEAAIERLARRELEAVLAREGLARRGVAVRFAPEVVAALARAGFHPRFGARPLKRELDRRVLAPLSRWLVRRGARAAAEVEVWLDGEEVRLAARERAAARTQATEFFDIGAGPEPAGIPARQSRAGAAPFTAERLREGLSAVRVRIAEARDSWILRSGRADATRARAADAELRRAAVALERLDGEVEAAAAGLASRPLADVARALAEVDEAATAAEVELLLSEARPAPLARLEVVEVAAALEPGAAAASLAEAIAAWARARGVAVEARAREGGGLELRFADGERAAALRALCGAHDFAEDLPDVRLLGARVRVGGETDEPALALAHAGRPEPHAADAASGLRQPLPLGAGALARFLLAGWRRGGGCS